MKVRFDEKHVVKIKKLHPDAVVPKYAHVGDAGFDLVAVEDKIVRPGESASVRTGLAFEIPQGMELQIRPRSGISKKTKLRISNSPGTVDSGYRGEVQVLFDNITSVDAMYMFAPTLNVSGETDEGDKVASGIYHIRKGDRIAQGVIAYLPSVILVETDELSETERGTGGFGSTGTIS